VAAALYNVLRAYRNRGFKVTECNADPEFQPLKGKLEGTSLNLCAQDEHVHDVERYIRSIKDRARSGYNSLPFPYVPRLVVIRLVGNTVFWLNAFPVADGVSDTLSPRYLMTGKHLDFNKHVQIEFGAYAQTHEEHDNSMQARTVGAICLGPTGNEQGAHYFMCLATGRRLTRNRWTELPMPRDVIARVAELGRRQGMPKTLTFADRYGHEILDEANDVDDDHDSDYDPDEESKQSSVSSGSYASSTSSGSDDDDDDDDDGNNAQVLPQQTAGVGAPPASANNDDSEGEDNDDSDDDGDEDPPDMFSHYSSDDESDSDDECPPSTQRS
jgi:hypothetical protein